MNKNKFTFGTTTNPEKIDDVVLANKTLFEIEVPRCAGYNDPIEARIFSALIEEILNLKQRVSELEAFTKLGVDK